MTTDQFYSLRGGSGFQSAPLIVRTPTVTSVLVRRLGLVIGTTIFFVVAGVVYLAVTPPRFMATSAILIDPRLGKSVGNDPNTPGFIADSAAIDSQIKLFTSQTVLAKVATRAHLGDDPEFNGSQRSLLQRLLRPKLTLDGGADLRALEQAITIKRPERTYVVEVDVLARNPAKAAEIANDLTEAYIEDQISSRVAAAREDSQYVVQKLGKLSTEIRSYDEKISSFKSAHAIVDVSGLRINEQQITDLTKALGDARTRASDIKSRLFEIEAMARTGRLDATSDATRSITVERLRQQQAEAEENAAKLAQTLGPHHPEMREALERQNRIRSLIRAELERLRAGTEADFRAALSHEKQITEQLAKLRGQSNQMERTEVPLEQLQRDRSVLQASFDRFAQLNSSIEQQEAQSPPGRVIAVARPPVSPSSPKKTIVAATSLAAGLFFGVVAALLAEGSDSSGGNRVQKQPEAPASPVHGQAPGPGDVEPAPASVRPRRHYWDDATDDWEP